MKKIVIILACLFTGAVLNAQMSEKFVKAMEPRVQMIDSNKTADSWKEMANAFERIADAEKTQWLPYYYAAFSNVMAGYMSMTPGDMGDKSALLDPFADKAESLINKAEEMSKDNSEIWCIRKMIATLRLSANPMARYMTEVAISDEAIKKAKDLNPSNPRVYLLMGQDKFYTPEQFGGSKTEAKTLFEEAIKLFAVQKPESTIHPAWGLAPTQYFLSLIN